MILFSQASTSHDKPEHERYCHIMSTGAILLADVSNISICLRLNDEP